MEVSQSLTSIIPVSVHQDVSPCPGVSFTPYHAGHVLGACMYMIDILGLKILYTGDYSREEDHHLVKAEIPPTRPDVLIVESTHGVHTFETRTEKELRFTALVHAILGRGGHVLLPVFALGTAQELLLVLEAYWQQHPDLHSVPIYYTSSLARKCMAVYQTHIHAMNANIRSRFAKRDNPFVFKWVFRPAHVLYSESFVDMSRVFPRGGTGCRTLLKVLHVSYLRVLDSWTLVAAENCLNSGPRILGTVLSLPDTLSKVPWPR